MEALDGLADAAADLRQLLGAENEGGDAGNHHQLRHPEAEHRLATQTTPLSGSITQSQTRIGPDFLVGQSGIGIGGRAREIRCCSWNCWSATYRESRHLRLWALVFSSVVLIGFYSGF